MPHTSYTRSCTIHSFNSTLLLLQQYEIETYINTSAGATSTLYNGRSSDTYQFSTTDVQEDGIWHKCASGGGGIVLWQLAVCQYLYVLDRTQSLLALDIQWYCDDRDPEHATDGQGPAVTVDFSVTCPRAHGAMKINIRCRRLVSSGMMTELRDIRCIPQGDI
ncbi:hypothetical protein F4677DRAFT_140307 [Hypoxylon crocopeplum]|nr:hypothetical protein F4677DRAFT_140307 [Hypoxylon crocopeplum]